LLHNGEKTEILNLPQELKGMEVTDCISANKINLDESIELKPYDFRIYEMENTSNP
jgi:hypothetical protein